MIASIISSVFLSTGKYWNSQSNVHIIVKSFVYHYYLYQLFVHPVPDASKPSNNSLDRSLTISQVRPGLQVWGPRCHSWCLPTQNALHQQHWQHLELVNSTHSQAHSRLWIRICILTWISKWFYYTLQFEKHWFKLKNHRVANRSSDISSFSCVNLWTSLSLSFLMGKWGPMPTF